MVQSKGLFGWGWSSTFDSTISSGGYNVLKLKKPDGQIALFLKNNSPSNHYDSISGPLEASIDVSSSAIYTLTFKDGRIDKFNSSGRLISMADRNGNETTLSYNGSTLTGITDPFGRTVSISINGSGRISAISDSTGTIAIYEYFPGTANLLKTVTYNDSSKLKFEYLTVGSKYYLTTVKDALDNVLENHQYDSNGRATTSELHGGVEKYTLDYTYSGLADDPHTDVTDALGRVTRYHFTRQYGINAITKIEGACSCGGGAEVTQYFYDAKLNLIKKVDALLNEFDYTYDDKSNLIRLDDPLGTQIWTYDQFGRVLTYNDRVDSQNPDLNVHTVVNSYDAKGNLLTYKDALNNVSTLTYTAQGQLATVTDARNNTATLGYDTQGRLTIVTDANGKATAFGYDARARVTSTTNAKSETTAFTYDLNNRLKQITFPDTNYVEHTYDLAGRRTATRDARGNSTAYGYDNAYRLTSVTDPLNHATTYGYDLMSNLTSETDALGNTTNLEYDDFNRLKKVIYPPATVGATRLEESVTYDKLGNVKTRVDTAGRTTAYDYDTSNRLTKITDALTNLTQFEYNLRSQMTKVKDALNQEYIFTYDPFGRVLSQTRAGTTMSFEYDAVGNRTKRTDYMGRVTDYQYDNLNRLTNILHGSTVDASYGYDDLSRLVSAVNAAGTATFTYDNRSRLKTETDVFGHVMEYGYDANGNRTQLKLDGSVHTAYSYDAANRLNTLTDDASQSFTYGYDIANRLISKALPNGITTTYDYDDMSRLTRLKDATTTTTLFDRQYSYNTANQISGITEPSRIRTFGYDNVDRLTSVTDPTNGNESYSFDAVGNRTSSHLSASYTTAPFNRLTAATGITQTFDANGNTATRSTATANWTYTWDFENRMTSASDGTSSVTYTFDALGRRVRRTDGSTDTKFTHDGQDVVLDDTSGSITSYQNGLGIDNKLSSKSGSVTNYLLADHLGTTNGLVDSTGAVASSADYDSFGNSTNGLTTKYQYTGREYDNFTGLYHYRARMYDSNLGRFISEDPIGFYGGDINLYGYARRNPLSWKDPSGLDLVGLVGGGSLHGGAVVGAGGTGSIQVGYGSDGFGSSASYGYFYGPGRTPADTSNNAGWDIGIAAGIGAGFFWSNADTWCQLGGDFETTLIGLGPIGTIEIDSGDNNVFVVQIYPGPLGKGPSYGLTHLRTNTPATGRLSDALDEASQKFRNGIRDNFGY